ncbi:M20/M25/M40 family metallo-hydrolase [Candidatus Gottesmanbacteria bacterium]|nr:M20/M25/M40 family metallo-hydrolase [Candidatus Gottesmanbacteria bacterium]
MKTLLADLVKIESYSGQEGTLASFVLNWAQLHGLKAEKQDGNVVITFVAHSSQALIFNAHMDTVKPGNVDFWSFPPVGVHAGVVKKGKLYGLGASDDKAAIAAFLGLAVQLKKTPPPLDVFIVFVISEETDGSGSQSFLHYFQKRHAANYQEVAVVIGEPTDLTSIEIGHRGNIFLKVTTSGDSGHGSQPESIKTHAIYNQIKIIEEIKKIGKFVATKYKDPVLGLPTFCLTGLQSDSTSVNTVSSTCSSTWDIRTTPKLHDTLVHLVEEKLGNKGNIECIGTPAPPGFTSPDSKIVKVLQNIVPGGKVTVSPGSNDICAFTAANVPAVAFGPGQKETIHKPNEYVQLQNITNAVGLYKQIIYSQYYV